LVEISGVVLAGHAVDRVIEVKGFHATELFLLRLCVLALLFGGAHVIYEAWILATGTSRGGFRACFALGVSFV